MRYGKSQSLSITSLTQGVAAPPFVAASVAPTGLPHPFAASRNAAGVVAVALAAVTPTTDVERCVATHAVRPAVAVVVLAGDRNLPPRGAGRADLDRGDSCLIPASLLNATGGKRFQDDPPRPPLPRGWGLLFRFGALRQDLWTEPPTRAPEMRPSG